MSNPIFNALGANMAPINNPAMDMIQQFQTFKKNMQGKTPAEEIQKLLQSGQISQQQLNQAQQMAMQMQNMLKGFMR